MMARPALFKPARRRKTIRLGTYEAPCALSRHLLRDIGLDPGAPRPPVDPVRRW